MASQNATNSPDSNKPALPANVSIFSPAKTSSVDALLGAQIFTRLAASTDTKPAQLAAAIDKYAGVDEGFCLSHNHSVLIFDGGDGDKQGEELEDMHHGHFRLVCLALKEYDIGLDVAGCISDAPDVLSAGFQLDKLGNGAALVIDLVEADDDSDSSTGSVIG
ncbi:hypothetical protein FZEAL_2171 [Fusarium zealandicum]|uniref:Uncharacterized protein n=1 Tax=Fusarium zealandicum TaxID=1053134 RepID=A0A8H4XN12_9HYPO|nr:hypothetical protein FZEAL_2171 [Fusarium zealandicum]